ncbi:MAG: hypothetical protein WDN06_09265 [Asticcacaulis sp.]
MTAIAIIAAVAPTAVLATVIVAIAIAIAVVAVAVMLAPALVVERRRRLDQAGHVQARMRLGRNRAKDQRSADKGKDRFHDIVIWPPA